MPRFLTRPRFITNPEKSGNNAPSLRSTSSVPKDLYLPRKSPHQSSYLVQYDTLPMRNAAGHALHYCGYSPSRYYVPFTHRTMRKPRQLPSVHPTISRDPPTHLNLDFDSVNRSRSRRLSRMNSNPNPSPSLPSSCQLSSRHPSGRQEANSIHHAIDLKVLALRRHLAHANNLGDLTILKRVVAGNRDSLARVRRARHAVLVQLHDAATIAGLPPPSSAVAPPIHGPYRRPTPIRAYPLAPPAITRVRPSLQPPSALCASPCVRRVGRPMRKLGGRTLSALKGRPAPRRSASHNSTDESNLPSTQPSFERLSQSLQGSVNRKGFVARSLSRKSSSTLKRLGSAGSMFMRRLSRGSVVTVDEPASMSSIPGGPLTCAVAAATGMVSSALAADTLARLHEDPASVVAELEVNAKKMQMEEKDTLSRLKAAERILDQRREVHGKAVSILDQFYGSLPGWQQDPVTQVMFSETIDMTDAALETERDLVEARHYLAQGHAALRDHSLALGAVQTIGEQLGSFITALERLIRSIAECESRGRADGCEGIPQFDGDIWPTLRQLEKHLDKCVGSGEMAMECCMDAPRVQQIERDLRTLRDGFVGESKAVESMGRIYQKDMLGSLHVAKSAVCDCKLAETFVREREGMIAEDVANFEEMTERCEEYVIQERMALVDLHHPVDTDQFDIDHTSS